MVRVLITEVAPGVAEGIRAALSTLDDIEIVGYARDGIEAVQMAVAFQPEVLLIHEQLAEMPGTMACELVTLAAPQVACALMCDRDDIATTARAMRAGARAIITPATTTEKLSETVRELRRLAERKETQEYRIATDPAAMPQTIAFLSARDGVGKSTLTANVATAFAKDHPDEVVVVDLCGQFASQALLLDLRPANNIVDLAGFATDMDVDLVETFLTPHPSGFKLLAGGSKPDAAWTDVLSVTFVATLLGLLRRRYPYVLCDMPTTVWPGGLYAISRSQAAVVVTSLWNITELQAVAELVDTLSPQYVSSERVRVVLNRSSDRDWFDKEELCVATGHDVWHEVPNDTQSVVAAANEGNPVVTVRPSSPFGKSALELCTKLIDELRGPSLAAA